MADRFASFRTPDQLRRVFSTVGAPPDWAPSWRVAPGDVVPVVVIEDGKRDRSIRLLRWGFVGRAMPDAAGDRAPPYRACTETVTSSQLFGEAFRTHRCLVPADVFYGQAVGPDGERNTMAHARMDGRPVALGGFWDGGRGEADGNREPADAGTFAILTLPARLADADGERRPVVIEEDDWQSWLAGAAADAGRLLRPAAKWVLRSWPVAPGLDGAARNGPELLEPIDG